MLGDIKTCMEGKYFLKIVPYNFYFGSLFFQELSRTGKDDHFREKPTGNAILLNFPGVFLAFNVSVGFLG